MANQAGRNSVFVIGRNIYQAACGSSRTANDFLNAFMTKTSGFDEDRRKALMDGILFEIFFDSGAQLRDQGKNRCLDQTFELQRYQELSASFAFVSECLLAHADRFHAIPGKDRAITADVVTKKKSGNKHVVKEVRFDGANILWIDDDNVVCAFADDSGYRKLSIKDFKKRLSDEMVALSSQTAVAAVLGKRRGLT